MNCFVEQGSSYREVLEKVRAKYGDEAQRLSYRDIKIGGFFGIGAKSGVEVTFYVSDDALRSNRTKDFQLEEQKRKLTERMAYEKNLQQEQMLQDIANKLRILTDTMPKLPYSEKREDHPTIQALDERLTDNDFSPWYRSQILSKARAEFSLGELEDYELVSDAVLEWIGDSILIPEEPKETKPRVIVLVGPTGVGKTTTIAKLAAIHSLGLKNLRPGTVRMMTIDTYRIGAVSQIEKYSDIMKIPLSLAENAEDIRANLARYSDADVVFIDTIGKSPKDAARLGEMQSVLEACGPHAEAYLAVSATTKAQDMLDILRQFEPFKYRAVIVTKLDETSRVGNVLSALAEAGKPVAWVCNGQTVPHDIRSAHPIQFLINLEGFRVNRPKLEERYGNLTD